MASVVGSLARRLSAGWSRLSHCTCLRTLRPGGSSRAPLGVIETRGPILSWQLNKTSIPEREWGAVADHCATTVSKNYRPLRGSLAVTYRCRAIDFINQETYLVRFTTPDGTALAQWDDPTAKPITVRVFVKNPMFVRSVNGDRDPNAYGPLPSAKLITMHCATCDRRVVIDGVHRLVRIASESIENAVLEVTELSGAAWPPNVPDMGKICRCR